MKLDGPWRFQVGDDPRWADPDFDDSTWATVTLGQSFTEQGLDSYSGYAWYRLRLQPQQLSQISKLPETSHRACFSPATQSGSLPHTSMEWNQAIHAE